MTRSHLAQMVIALVVTGFGPPVAFAAVNAPQAVSLGGELFMPSGDLITNVSVNFKVQVLDANDTCVLYSEVHASQNLQATKGRFNLILGTGSSIVNNVSNSNLLDAKIFLNSGQTPVANCSQSPVALNPGDQRQIRISYDVGGGYVALAPDVPMVSSAFALVADTLQGKAATDLIQVVDNGTTVLNQSNANYTFSATNWPRLKALLDGTSSQYLATTPSGPLNLNNQRITNVQNPTNAQDAATKNYADTTIGGRSIDLSAIGPMTGDNSVLRWDATANRWVAGAMSSAPTGAAGGDLTGTYPNPTIANNAITSAKINATGVGVNRLLITDATTGATVGYGSCAINQIYAWTATGWACTTVAALSPVTSVASRTGAIVLTAGDIGGLGTSALYDWGTAANQIVRLDGSARLAAVDGSMLTNVNAVKLQTRDVAAVAPTTGQVLGWNGSAWVPVNAAAGAVTSVTAGAGLLGGSITSSGTLAVDTGTTGGKILQLTGSAQVPAVDGSQLFNVNAAQIATRTVASTAPGAGQVLGWNGTTNQWEPISAATGSVTNVTSGAGLVGGPITSNGTLAVDIGTTASKILQLNALAQLPAVDGSLLTSINAVKLQSRAISTTAPNAGQVLGWNATTAQWEPATASAGSVTNVTTGNGLLGGTITSSGTVAIDAGTTANKILQLNASAQIPAVDGSLLTAVNAVRLQTRGISASAPGAGQVLGWNGSTNQWEPISAATGSVTNVASGIGLVGGPISSNGTLAVDVGTTASKVLQLNASAQLPAVDGSLLTFINAVKLQARTVAATAPGAGQVLGWNAATAQWEPSTASSGSVTNVTTGNGLVGGAITSSGTIAIDAGTAANKILQLNAAAQIPGVDGSLLTSINAVKLQTRTVSATAPGAGQVLGWNGTTNQWEPISAATGSVTNVASGVGLTGGPISSNGTLAVDVGTTASKILQLNASSQIPGVDGSLLTSINAVKLQTRAVSASAPGAGQVLSFNASTNQWEPSTASSGSVTNVTTGNGLVGGAITSAGTIAIDAGTAANKILQLNASAQIPSVDGSLLTSINAVKLQTRTVSATAPAAGQVLGWNGSTNQWEPISAASGSVTSVASGVGLLGGPISSNGTLVVDVGTTASKILQLNASAQVPAVDGSLLTSINAVKLQTRAVSTAAPGAGQVLGWNGSTNQWEPISVATGSVTNVASGTGLLGGPISSNGTLAVDVGTTANKILQLNASSQLPAVDGSLVTSINAVKLQTRTVSATAPNAGQVLGWNATTAQWEPATASGGSVTNVTAGNGLLGGPITYAGTIAIDVGTAANKILQLNASSQIPAVDGSLLTSINAVKLQTRAISPGAPGAGQVLGWNGSTNQWEPVSAATGSVTNVASGVGLVGGPITANGTLAVDVGTAANKILQLNASALIPAVDASLLYNVNATKIATRTVSGAAPAAGQTLAWNSSTAQWEPSTPNSVSGTTNYIAKYSSASALGNSLFFDNGTTAAVGSATVGDEMLSVAGGLYIDTLNQNSGTISRALRFGGNGSATGIGSKQTAGGNQYGIDFYTGYTNRLAITNAGLIGINTSAPQAGLDIALTGTIASAIIVPRDSTTNRPSTPVNGMLRYNNTLNAMEGYINGAWSTLASGSSAGTLTNIASGVGLLGGPITTSGTLSVDVGTAGGKIVQLNASAQLAPSSGSVGLPAYSFAGNTATGMYSPASNQLSLATNGTAAVTIAANGFVGIGSASPTTMLAVAGTMPAADVSLGMRNLSSTGTTKYIFNNDATGYTGVEMYGSNHATTYLRNAALYTSSNDMYYMTNSSVQNGGTGKITFMTGGWDTTTQIRAVIDAAGRMGVGTSLPQSGLDIATTGTIGSAVIIPRDSTTNRPSNAINGMLRYNNTLNVMEGYINGAWSTLSTGGGSSGTVTNITTSTGLLGGPISSAGTLSVDIGTGPSKIPQLNPTSQLALANGAVATPTYSFAQSSSTGLFSPVSNGLALVTNGTVALTISPAGSVGIGTSTPAGGLDIWTNQTESFHVRDNSNAANPYYFYAAANRSGGGYVDIGGYQGGVGPVSLILNRSGGNVGIGSTAPDFKFVVAGGTNAARFTTLDFAQGTTGSNIGIYTGANTGNTYGAIQSASGGGGTPTILSLNPSGGSVGIGSTTAESKLYVTDGNHNGTLALTINDNESAADLASLPTLSGASLSWNISNAWGEVNLINRGGGGSTQGFTFVQQTGAGTFSYPMRIEGSTGNVGVGTTTPQAALDVSATGTARSAIIVPRDSTTNRPSAPVNGMIRYNTTLNALEGYVNGAWASLTGGSGGGGGGGSTISCGDYSTNQATLISSANSYFAPFCLIGQSTSYQNPNWTGRAAATFNNAVTSCASEGADLCSMSDLKKAYGTSAGNTGMNGLSLWTSNKGYVGQIQNGTTCQGGTTCYPQEWQPYIFQNGSFSNSHYDLSQQQTQFFCCRH